MELSNQYECTWVVILLCKTSDMLNTIKIGFLLAPGFQPAEMIGINAVLGIHPLNKSYFIGQSNKVVYGNYSFGIKPNTAFVDCPKLDALIVVGMSNEQLRNDNILKFIKVISDSSTHIIAVSNGVTALYRAGVIKSQRVTSDNQTLEELRDTDLQIEAVDTCVIDGKFITSGPSTGAIEAAFTLLNKSRGKWITKLAEFNLEYDPIVQYPCDSKTTLRQPTIPKPLKVGLFLPDGAYLPDYMGAVDVFSKIPNTEFYYINTQTKEMSSTILGPHVTTNTTIDKCPQLNVLIVGATLPKYIQDKKVLNFFVAQEELAQAIISVCAGTFIVGAAGLLENRVVTTNYHQTIDLKRVGAHFNGEEVEVDGKFFSAGPAVGSYEVGLKAVEKIVSKEWAQFIEYQILEFKPKPVYGCNMKTVDKSILGVTNALSIILRQVYRTSIRKGYQQKKLNPMKNKSSFILNNP